MTTTTEYLAGLEIAGLRRLIGRVSLLHAVMRYRAMEGVSDRQALETLAEQFNSGEAPVEPWVYEVYASVSGRTLRRWKERLDEGGLIGLSDDYGTRSERTYASYFDTGSPLRKVALHHLADHPDCTAGDLLAELRRQFADSELPDLRTVQRFLGRLRG